MISDHVLSLFVRQNDSRIARIWLGRQTWLERRTKEFDPARNAVQPDPMSNRFLQQSLSFALMP